NLLILFLIFRFILFKRVDKILRLREKEMEDVKSEAAKVKAEAEAAKEKYEKEYARLEAEKEAVFAQTKKTAYGVRERILNEAQQQTEKMIEEAKRSADDTYAKERSKNEDAIAELVLNAASKISEQTHSREGDLALYDRFIKSALEELPISKEAAEA
ncbi:MAG: hypothetical protein IJ679_04470, partial [Lachnospiraceae bacterium]|nr:hypothetical protein [Lachnospiraceae bacterium]